jgi:hypothetical protein
MLTGFGPSGPMPPGRAGPDRSRVLIGGAIAVVLAVIIGVLVGERTSNDSTDTAATFPRSSSTSESTDSSDATGSTESSSSSESSSSDSQDLDAVVQDIEAFVERERGLKFKQRVKPVLAGEGEFQRLLLKDFDQSRPSLVETQEVLTAIGLLDPGTDVVEAERTLLDVGVVGFYDPESKELVVRGSEVTPYVREVLAHELTHALDDQWFNLNRPALDEVDDNARRVEDAYLASLPLDEQEQAFAEQQDLVAQHPEVFDIPFILITLLQAPYEDGPPFIDALLSDGGQQKLDQTFAAPPIDSEQILHPDRFLAGDVPKPVPQPTADGQQSNVGALGELLFVQMLSNSVGSSSRVNKATTGWGGDTYVTWTDSGGRSCLRDTFVGDTPADTLELVDAVQAWAADHGATVDAPADGPATFTACN